MSKPTVELPESLAAIMLHGKSRGANIFTVEFTLEGSDQRVLLPYTKPTSDEARQAVLDYVVERKQAEEDALAAANSDNPPDLSWIKDYPEQHVNSLIDAILNGGFKIDVDKAMKVAMRRRAKGITDPNVVDQRKVKKEWYHDPKTGERTRASETEKVDLIAKGWKPGRDVDATPDYKWYHRPVPGHKGYVERERIQMFQIPGYVADGYHLGKGSGKTWTEEIAKAIEAGKSVEEAEKASESENTEGNESDVGEVDSPTDTTAEQNEAA